MRRCREMNDKRSLRPIMIRIAVCAPCSFCLPFSRSIFFRKSGSANGTRTSARISFSRHTSASVFMMKVKRGMKGSDCSLPSFVTCKRDFDLIFVAGKIVALDRNFRLLVLVRFFHLQQGRAGVEGFELHPAGFCHICEGREFVEHVHSARTAHPL